MTNDREARLEDAVERMVAILEMLAKGKDHRPDVLRQVIGIGDRALEKEPGE